MQTTNSSTASDLFSVRDQVVLVTGGSRGIGRAIAEGFAVRGAQVVISSRDEKVLNEAARQMATQDVKVHAIPGDVSRTVDSSQLVATVLEKFGRIDTLVNSAGVNLRKPILGMSEKDFDFLLDINLKGAFFLAQAVGKHMVERRSGCQIHIASLSTLRPLPNVAPYAISKAGMGQMTRALALEWGPAGVRVNAIAPGFILTDLTKKLWSDEKLNAWGVANIPQRRLGQPEDLIGAALFLASPAAAYLTGQIICVDGGFSCGWSWPFPEK
jgi:gluconate 5-dehydrogenase